MQRTSRFVILAGAAAAAAAVPALASEPSSGTVSLASPTVAWTGVATGYGVVPTNILVTTAGESPVCPPQACDTFALTVADQADLSVVAANRGGENFTELHVIKPDGEVVYVLSAENQSASAKIKNAAAGDYTIEVLTNEPVIADGEYDATATLGAKPAASTTPPPTGTSPTPTPAPPAPARPAATLSLTTKSLSARRARKRVKLGVATSSPVTNLSVALRKGRKVVARGRLARLESRGSVTLKLRKAIRPGRYTVVLAARDDQGNNVGTSTRLTIRK